MSTKFGLLVLIYVIYLKEIGYYSSIKIKTLLGTQCQLKIELILIIALRKIFCYALWSKLFSIARDLTKIIHDECTLADTHPGLSASPGSVPAKAGMR